MGGNVIEMERKNKAFTLLLTPKELETIKAKADRIGISASRLMVLGAINWDGKIKYDQ